MQNSNTIDIRNIHELENELSTLLSKPISSGEDLENWLKTQSKLI